jgi:putative transcriptional regulator
MIKKLSIGRQIIEGLGQAIAYERGRIPGVQVSRVPLTARVAQAPPAPQPNGAAVARLRARLRLSQAVFAQALNVSAETVRAWEQGKRTPDGAALRLLQIAQRHPWVILENVRAEVPPLALSKRGLQAGRRS